MNALVVVDLQNDFLPGGALPVPFGDTIVPLICQLAERFKANGDVVVATKDWHPKDHGSFANQHGKAAFTMGELNGKPQMLWPPHCIQNTCGSEFADVLLRNETFIDRVFYKGTNREADSYSGCYDDDGNPTGMIEYLREKGVDGRIFVAGLALDYCVYATYKDLCQDGSFFLATYIVLDATKAIKFAGNENIMGKFDYVLSSDIPAMLRW